MRLSINGPKEAADDPLEIAVPLQFDLTDCLGEDDPAYEGGFLSPPVSLAGWESQIR